MSTDRGDVDDGRRTFMKTLAIGAAAGGLAVAGVRPASAQSDSVDLTDWFANTDNADEVVDRTGESEVTVEVGTDGNGAAFGYGPAVVRVDPGTTVVWEWTGEGAPHDVAAEDDSFGSDMLGDAGATFEHAFESAGVTRYYCTPHKAMGMKGAVVVGDVDVTLPGGGSGSEGGGDSGGESGDGGSGGDGDAGENREMASVDPDYDGWFDGVDNFDGTVDMTGRDEVRIEVGTENGGGPFGFDPAAIHVDPGTTVIWEWTGEGGQHNVASDDPAFESPMQADAGATYGLEFDGQGICKYVCTPHEGAGMKGAVVVGDPAGAAGGVDYLKTALWGLAGAIVAAPFVASEVVARRRRDEGDGDGGRGPGDRPGTGGVGDESGKVPVQPGD